MVLAATVLAVAVVVAVVFSVGHDLGTRQNTGATPPALSSLPRSQVPQSPTLPGPAPTSLEFVLSGYAPRNSHGMGPEIAYGSDRGTREAQPPGIDGTVTYSVPFDPTAQSYAVRAKLAGSGHLTCTIIVIRPHPDKPLTVSSGQAGGGDSVCSARAIPADPNGLSWRGGS